MKKVFMLLSFTILFASCNQGMNKDDDSSTQVKPTFTITVNQPQNGKITVKDKASNKVLEGEALTKVAKDTVVTISIEANAGYKVDSLTIDGTSYTESSKDITVTKSIEVSGVISQENPATSTFTIAVNQPQNGKITVKDKVSNKVLEGEALTKVAKDTVVIVTLKATSGKVKALIINGVRNPIVIANQISQEIIVDKNITVEGEVKIELKYSLNVIDVEGGKIKIEKKGAYGWMDILPSDYNSIDPNTKIRITLEPNADYDGKAIIINGVRHEGVQKEETVNGNLGISAEFSKKANTCFTVTINNPEHGTITVKDKTTGKMLEGDALKNIPDGTILVIKLNFDTAHGDRDKSKLIINGTEYPFTYRYTIHENIVVTGKVEK